MSVLEKVRRWIDGETSELVLEEAARDAQVKPRSQAEEFIVKIARAVEEVMQREMVPLPQGTAIIPTEYIIFLSEPDDKDWQGVKRKGLEQGLYHILAERAKEIAGKKKLETQSFAVELRVDGTMEKGDIRVQHGWEDSNASKTSVLSRPKPQPTGPPANAAPKPANEGLQAPNFVQNQQYGQNRPAVQQPGLAEEPPPTMLPGGYSQVTPIQNVPPAGGLPAEESVEEMTHVQKRRAELYKIEVWRGGVRQSVVPVYQKEVSVGRGSKSKPVDIPLPGDLEISRRHLILITDGNGHFWLVNEGRNPATVNNYELPVGQRIAINPGVPINVCTYMLRIQPK